MEEFAHRGARFVTERRALNARNLARLAVLRAVTGLNAFRADLGHRGLLSSNPANVSVAIKQVATRRKTLCRKKSSRNFFAKTFANGGAIWYNGDAVGAGALAESIHSILYGVRATPKGGRNEFFSNFCKKQARRRLGSAFFAASGLRGRGCGDFLRDVALGRRNGKRRDF
jgi:hypothetical protein